jgi:hypothetical protein
MADRVVQDMARMIQDRSSSGNATITINAGGPALWVAVWFSTLACAVMLTIAMLSRNDLVDQSRRLDLANDKLSIILQWAPDLKNIVDKQIQQQKKDK